MIIRNVDINETITNVRIANNVIAEIGQAIIGEDVYEGHGGALLPGLHDHHIHLNAAAAAMNSLRCGPPQIITKSELIETLHKTGEGWIRGVGYHASVAGEIDRAWLDKNGPERPIRIQHRSGRLWILNSLGMRALGLNAPHDGRLLDQDAHLPTRTELPDLQPFIQRLLSWGVTGVTEVTPSNDVKMRETYLRTAHQLNLSVMGNSELSEGHLKLHYHDHDLPALDDLAYEISVAHGQGRNVAAHCVTRAELMLTLAAIEQAGPADGDRIEHAAIADDAAIAWMKALNLIVVTQPNFIKERVEAYRREVPEKDHANLWRLKAFQTADLRMAAGSDAPFGDPNPWKAMAAAVSRPAGFEGEAIAPEEALALYTKPAEAAGAAPRKVEVGAKADLCLIDRPWKDARENLRDVKVMATWIGGKLVYNGVDEAPI